MKDVVLAVLDRPEIRKFAFGFGTIYINALNYEAVKTALRDGKISAEYSSKIGARRGKYTYTANKFILGFKKTDGDIDREALIVHESVHAIFDVQVKPLIVKESEAAAYIAQCLYFYYRNEAAFKAGHTPTFADPILKAAWAVAEISRRHSMLDDADMKPLFAAIAAHSLYKNRHSDAEAYDGV